MCRLRLIIVARDVICNSLGQIVLGPDLELFSIVIGITEEKWGRGEVETLLDLIPSVSSGRCDQRW